MKHLKYKNYVGSVELDVDDGILYGKLLFISDLVNYEGTTVPELQAAFEAAVDDYLFDCDERGVLPNLPFKGQFNVRVDPALHRSLALAAMQSGHSMNEYVSKILKCHNEVGSDGRVEVEKLDLARVLSNSSHFKLLKTAGVQRDVDFSTENLTHTSKEKGTFTVFTGGKYGEH